MEDLKTEATSVALPFGMYKPTHSAKVFPYPAYFDKFVYKVGECPKRPFCGSEAFLGGSSVDAVDPSISRLNKTTMIAASFLQEVCRLEGGISHPHHVCGCQLSPVWQWPWCLRHLPSRLRSYSKVWIRSWWTGWSRTSSKYTCDSSLDAALLFSVSAVVL